MLAHIVSPGEGKGWDALLLWGFDPLWLLFVLLPGALYARGLCSWNNKPISWSSWRPYSFYAGLILISIALVSPVDALANDMFTFHMLQHLILQMMGPPLVLLGAPTTPVLLGLPLKVRQHLVKPLVRDQRIRATYGFFTLPAVAWALFSLSTWSWHFIDGAYDAALRNDLVHSAQHFSFGFTAFLLWWTIIDPAPLRSKLSYPLRVPLLVLTILQNVFLGAALTLRGDILYPYYENRIRLWGLSTLDDQQAGGAMMWVVGVMMLMIALVVTVAVWFDKSERQARERENAIDAKKVNESPLKRNRL